MSVLLGNGLGSFAASLNYAVGMAPFSVAVGDIDGDLKQDLVVANQNSGNVSVLLGNGMGGFVAATNFASGTQTISVGLGDFNGDRLPDVATANFGGTNASVLLQKCQ